MSKEESNSESLPITFTAADKEVIEFFRFLLQDPEFHRKFLLSKGQRPFSGEVPIGSKALETTNWPYYTAKAAEWLKPMLDDILVHNEPIVFKARSWGMSPSSLKNKVNQAWRYLMDHMEDENKYLSLWQRCEINKDPLGCCITPVADENINDTENKGWERGKKDINIYKWKTELEEWLVNAPIGDTTKIENVVFDSDEERDELNDRLTALRPLIFHALKGNILMIGKTPPEAINENK